MTLREPEPGWGHEDIERKNEEEEPDPRIKSQGRPEADVPHAKAKPAPGRPGPVSGPA